MSEGQGDASTSSAGWAAAALVEEELADIGLATDALCGPRV